MRKLLLLLMLFASVLVACDREDETHGGRFAEGTELIEVEDGVRYFLHEAGSGETPRDNDIVTITYVGTLADGTVFNESEEFKARIGTNMMVPGLDIGLRALQEGAKATLVVDPEHAFGDRGSQKTVPPGATVYYEVTLLKVVRFDPGEGYARLSAEDYTVTPVGTRYYDFETGEGEVAELGQTITFTFFSWVEGEDLPWNSTQLRENSGDAYVYGVSITDMVGWEEAFTDIRVGTKRQFVLTPDLGFRNKNHPYVPPNKDLYYVIEVLSIE